MLGSTLPSLKSQRPSSQKGWVLSNNPYLSSITYVGSEMALLNILVGSAASSGLSAFITTPMDVVKTRLQIQSVAEGGYSGMGHAFRTIYETEGVGAFFKGSAARVMWLMPSAALGLSFCKYKMKKSNTEDEELKRGYEALH